MVEGGTAHGWERSTDQLVYLEVPPAPVYKGWRRGGRPAPRALQKFGVLLGLPSPSRIPPPIWNRKRGREKEEGKKRRKEGGAPPS